MEPSFTTGHEWLFIGNSNCALISINTVYGYISLHQYSKQTMLKYLSNRVLIAHDTVFDPLNIPIETVINYHGGSLSLCWIRVRAGPHVDQIMLYQTLYINLVNFIVL